VAWYEDPGTSAKSLRRPGVRAALDDLDSGQADALIVAKLDRLTRSVRDLVNLMDRYFASGRVALLSVGEQVDTRTATGRMVLNVIATISQWERERIGERVRDMHRVKRARGERVGKLTYGYRVGPDGRALEPHPEEQAVIRVMQTLRADGMSFKTIADELTTRGLPARGSRWHATSVRRILTRAA
jgi:DNA invertase Pin-like site-specific DNA recombinase